MSIEHLEVLVEEPSMEACLRHLLPRLLDANPIDFDVYPFRDKQDLLAKLPARLRGYARWLPDDYRILVLVDRDGDDCRELKNQLESIAHHSGLATRATSGDRASVINRIVIEELEAWYFGDWSAVCSAFPKVPRNIPRKQHFRNPDAVPGGTWEALERLLQRAGYYRGGLQKIDAARRIGEHLDPERNSSRSFQVFREALARLTAST